jgi:hypothetical protein
MTDTFPLKRLVVLLEHYPDLFTNKFRRLLSIGVSDSADSCSTLIISDHVDFITIEYVQSTELGRFGEFEYFITNDFHRSFCLIEGISNSLSNMFG